jgi:hypothetical protein
MTFRSWVLLLVGGALFALVMVLHGHFGSSLLFLIIPAIILVVFILSIFDDMSD